MKTFNPKQFAQKHPNARPQRQIDPGFRHPLPNRPYPGARLGGAAPLGQKKRPKITGSGFKRGGGTATSSTPSAPSAGGAAPAKHKKGGGASGPFDLNAPLTKKTYQQQIRAMADLEFNDKQRELEGQSRASDMQTGRIGDWFSQYQAQLANLRSQTQSNYANTNTQMQGNLQNAANRDQQQGANDQQTAVQQAALRGVPYTPGPDTSQAASNVRQSLGTGYSNMLGAQGAANYAYLADKEGIAGNEKINQLLSEAARGRNIHASLAQLMGDKGLARVKAAQDLREAERKYYISKATIAAENKRALITANTSSANNKRTNATSRANNAATTSTSAANNNADNLTALQKQKLADKDRGKTQRAKDKAAKGRAVIQARKKGHHN